MKRVEAAINDGRCVLAVGGRALGNPQVLAELRRRQVPAVALGAEAANPTSALSAAALSPVLAQQGGVLVLVEPEAATDGRALGQIAELIKAGAHRPRLYVAARAFNPFAMPMSLRLLKMEQIKSRAKDFLASLPVGAPVVAVAAAPKRVEKPRHQAPRPILVGREEELQALGALLESDGGPIVVTGPPGVGRRWLVEQALASSDLERLPDLTIGHGSQADSFLALVAAFTNAAGDARLHRAIRQPRGRPTPTEIAELTAEILQSEAMAGRALVIHGISSLLDRRDRSFYREGSLELLLRRLLLSQPALRLVFISEHVPSFYREGQSANLRVLELGGLKGRELFDLYQNHHAPEFPRDRFGPINERTFGHPMANRYLALVVREEKDIDGLLKQPRFLKSSEAGDLEALRRHLGRRIGDLDEAQRGRLAAAALLREPALPDALQAIGINRTARLQLLAAGLLEQTPSQDERRYYIHPLVAEQLTMREIEDFERMEALGNHYLEVCRRQRRDQPLMALRSAQEGNRLLTLARRGRSRTGMDYPDFDAIVENIRGILRRKKPRLDIARLRLNEALRKGAESPALLLLDAQLKEAERVKADVIIAAYARGIEAAPTPEIFHALASFHGSRSARGRAVEALTAGIALFPENARMRRRLAGLYMQQRRFAEATTLLEAARDLEPMMPDTYSLLGEIYTQLGGERWEDAQASLEEAARLAPQSPHHLARQASLLRKRAMLDTEGRAELLEQAEALLRDAQTREGKNPRVLLLLADVLLDKADGDLEQADWLVRQARRRHDRAGAMVTQARILMRRGSLDEAEVLLNKVLASEGSPTEGYAVLAELLMMKGQVFPAFEALKTARERTGKNAAERQVYERRMQEIGALIESGQAAIMMANAAARVPTVEEAPQRSEETRRVRKRGGRGRRRAKSPRPSPPTGAPTEAAEAGAAAPAAPAQPAENESVESNAGAVESDSGAEAAPAETAPAETAPAETAPTETAPTETAPTETVSTEDGPEGTS